MSHGIKICDTTLRDGEQMPGVVFAPGQKIELARRISDFGADVIELMPAVSPSECDTTRAIANMGLGATEITASTMLRKADIETAAGCGVQSVTLFTPLSDIHLQHKLGIGWEDNLAKALEMVDFARAQGLKVNFAGEDSTRTEKGRLLEFINALPKDIGYFLVCDTLGCLTPAKAYSLFSDVCTASKIPIGVHAHNDFGMATANTLAAVAGGASVISGTFTGIGERAGNAPLEEVILALRFLYGKELDVRYNDLAGLCGLVEGYSGVGLQPHKPVIGSNAFTHESGIHADGVIKYPGTYENFPPETISRERRILFGKHSGRKVLEHFFGKELGGEGIRLLLEKVKAVSETEKRALSLEEVKEISKGLAVAREVRA
ncbi:MAG: homoaconitate hydratase [Candidatus Aenigmarchaeota archaeon]|nr:homoaconitate hydratase [Candidatus Aenigmarchaeota archaeon]